MHIRSVIYGKKRKVNITERRRNGDWMALNSHWMVTEMYLPFSRLNSDWKVTEWRLSVFMEWWRCEYPFNCNSQTQVACSPGCYNIQSRWWFIANCNCRLCEHQFYKLIYFKHKFKCLFSYTMSAETPNVIYTSNIEDTEDLRHKLIVTNLWVITKSFFLDNDSF